MKKFVAAATALLAALFAMIYVGCSGPGDVKSTDIHWYDGITFTKSDFVGTWVNESSTTYSVYDLREDNTLRYGRADTLEKALAAASQDKSNSTWRHNGNDYFVRLSHTNTSVQKYIYLSSDGSKAKGIASNSEPNDGGIAGAGVYKR